MAHPLSQQLGTTFTSNVLLTQALTHSSTQADAHYERLEFLGDRVLNLVMAELVYQEFPDDAEGQLAKRHAALVREDTLIKVAEKIELAQHIQLGAGEQGEVTPSVLADVMEAVLAVIYLEQGLEVAKPIIRTLWAPHLHTVPLLDAKSELQEHLQGQGLPLPSYDVIGTQGQDHNRIFTIKVTSDAGCAVGQGASKQAASQTAAEGLLIKMGVRQERGKS